MFRVFGIQLAVHASFFLLLVYAGYEGWVIGGQVGMIWRIELICCFFICVVLHELGHSLTARRYGVNVPRILLLPIGGMAEMDRIPRKPSAEFLITIAGPAVNFLIAGLLLPVVWHGVMGPEVPDFSVADLWVNLFWGNLVMGTFNFLPVYPMDGGRIFRSILAIWLPYLTATRWAVITTRVLAPILAFVAIYYLDWWMLGVLFVFILFVANKEYQVLLQREAEAAYWAQRAMTVSPSPDEPPPLLIHGPN